jgi:hypothetical protein
MEDKPGCHKGGKKMPRKNCNARERDRGRRLKINKLLGKKPGQKQEEKYIWTYWYPEEEDGMFPGVLVAYAERQRVCR